LKADTWQFIVNIELVIVIMQKKIVINSIKMPQYHVIDDVFIDQYMNPLTRLTLDKSCGLIGTNECRWDRTVLNPHLYVTDFRSFVWSHTFFQLCSDFLDMVEKANLATKCH